MDVALEPLSQRAKIEELVERLAERRRQSEGAPPHAAPPADLLGEFGAAIELLQGCAAELAQREAELAGCQGELTAAREQLGALERRYSDLFEAAPDGYLVTDMAGQIQRVNGIAASLLERKASALAGTPLGGLLHEAERDRLMSDLSRLRFVDYVAEWPLRITIAGGERELVANVVAVRDQEHHPAELRWVLRDATKRRETEDHLRAELSQVQAELAQRTQQLHALAASHRHFLAELTQELRVPLQPVSHVLQDLLKVGPADSASGLEQARNGIELELALLGDLMNLADLARQQFELGERNCDMHALVRQAVEMTSARVDRPLGEIVSDLRAPRHCARISPALVVLALRQLLEAIARGGAARIEISSQNEEGSWQLEMSSMNATEVDSTEQARVAEVTRTAQVLLAAEEVAVESRFEGRRLRVRVQVPLADQEQAAPGAGGATLAGNLHSPAACRLLLVEDHQDTAALLGRLLNKLGYKPTVAATMSEALQLLDEQTFDVMVSDVGLPDGDGKQLMRLAVQKQPLRGIALSGYGMEEDERTALEAGFVRYLTKPVRVAQLAEVIREVMARESS